MLAEGSQGNARNYREIILQPAPTYAKDVPLNINTGGIIMMITDHKKLDSVRRYADVQVARKRALMERGKIIPITIREKQNDRH